VRCVSARSRWSVSHPQDQLRDASARWIGGEPFVVRAGRGGLEALEGIAVSCRQGGRLVFVVEA
jgi:hypothetical protein